MTKTDLLAVARCRPDIADFHLAIGDNDAVDEQFRSTAASGQSAPGPVLAAHERRSLRSKLINRRVRGVDPPALRVAFAARRGLRDGVPGPFGDAHTLPAGRCPPDRHPSSAPIAG